MIALLEAIELLTVVFIFVFGFTQVVLPLLRNQRVFPVFRKVGRLQDELGEAREEVQAAELGREVQRTHNKALHISEGEEE